MAKEIYIGGSGGKAEHVTDVYLGGSDGKARMVKKAYIGDSNGKARLFFVRKEYYTVTYHVTSFVTNSSSGGWRYRSTYESADYRDNVRTPADSTTFTEVVPLYGNGVTSEIYLYFSNRSPAIVPSGASLISINSRIKSAHSTVGGSGGHPWISKYSAIYMNKDYETLGNSTSLMKFTDTQTTARFFTLDTGDISGWTPEDLTDLYLRLTVTRSSNYSATDLPIRLYGVDLTINYRA